MLTASPKRDHFDTPGSAVIPGVFQRFDSWNGATVGFSERGLFRFDYRIAVFEPSSKTHGLRGNALRAYLTVLTVDWIITKTVSEYGIATNDARAAIEAQTIDSAKAGVYDEIVDAYFRRVEAELERPALLFTHWVSALRGIFFTSEPSWINASTSIRRLDPSWPKRKSRLKRDGRDERIQLLTRKFDGLTIWRRRCHRLRCIC
jgi:hypothetical protein